jgi:hypothetical protein
LAIPLIKIIFKYVRASPDLAPRHCANAKEKPAQLLGATLSPNLRLFTGAEAIIGNLNSSNGVPS